MSTRRDFLKTLGGALGGAVLVSSCGSGGGGGGNSGGGLPVPGGYKFYTIMRPGDPLTGGNAVKSFPGVAMINDKSEIVFYANDSAGALGAYKVGLDFSSPVPALQRTTKLVRQGDIIDEEEVSRLNIGSFNNSGWLASILYMKSGLCGVYVYRDQTGTVPEVMPLRTIPSALSGSREHFTGKFMEVDLDHENSLLISASFSTNHESIPQEGIIVLPDAEISNRGKVFHQEGIELPGGEELIDGYGLIDIAGKGGNYALQVFAGGNEPPSQVLKAAPQRRRATAVVTGNIYDPQIRMRTISASPSTSLYKKFKGVSKALPGESYYGPRIGNSGAIAHVLHKTDDIAGLFFNNNEVIATGGTTPLGNVVRSFGGPVVADDGLLYIVVSTSSGEELCIYNGSVLKTVLASGDVITDQGPDVGPIIFGTVPDMIDSHGRIVFFVQYEDLSRALVVGIPQ